MPGGLSGRDNRGSDVVYPHRMEEEMQLRRNAPSTRSCCSRQEAGQTGVAGMVCQGPCPLVCKPGAHRRLGQEPNGAHFLGGNDLGLFISVTE